MKIVITGNYEQYCQYLYENNLTRQEARYVNRPEKLRGLRNIEVVKYGEYWKNPCYNDPYLKLAILPYETCIVKKQPNVFVRMWKKLLTYFINLTGIQKIYSKQRWR